jgi:hypothetical protein
MNAETAQSSGAPSPAPEPAHAPAAKEPGIVERIDPDEAADCVNSFLKQRSTRAGRPYNNPLITSWHGVELREPHLRALLIERDEQRARVNRVTETLRDVNEHRNQLVRDLTECAQATPGEYWRSVAARHQPGALASPQPPAPHRVTVTSLGSDFDLSDKREHELLITDNATGGWISHLVQHPAACHQLAYGAVCWFDDEWESGHFSYDGIAPGVYDVLSGRQDVGDHFGEYSHTEEYLDYVRIGDAPERPPGAAPTAAGHSEEPPF